MPVPTTDSARVEVPLLAASAADLDRLNREQKGGESGPAIVPGKPEESLLIEAVRYESLEMPNILERRPLFFLISELIFKENVHIIWSPE